MAKLVKDLLNPDGKYHAVNFPSSDRDYCTIEVRLHSGTMEAWKIKRWVKLLLQLLEGCKDVWDEELRLYVRRGSQLQLLNMFVDEEVRSHLLRRAFYFARRYPDAGLVSDELPWLRRAAEHGYPEDGTWWEYDCGSCGERFPADMALDEDRALCWSCLHNPKRASAPGVQEELCQGWPVNLCRKCGKIFPSKRPYFGRKLPTCRSCT